MPSRAIGLAEDLALRPRQLRIFISSKMDGTLREERLATAAAVEGPELGTGWYHAWYWERNAVAGPYSSEPLCITAAHASDGLILLIAHTVAGTTRKEYEAARNSGVPCFVFLKEGIERDEETRKFIKEERDRGCVTVNFHTADDLRPHVVAAIGTSTVLATRRQNAMRRYHRSEAVAEWPLSSASSGSLTYPAAYSASWGVRVDAGGGRLFSLDEVAEAVRKAAAARHFRGAVELVLRASAGTQALGLPRATLELLTVLRSAVPPEAVGPADLAWLFNAEGLALSHLGQREEAITAFDQMQVLGQEVGDKDAVATAMQNLGILALLAGDGNTAERLYRQALRIKEAIGDDYGALQLLLNLAALKLETGEPEAATKILTTISPVLQEAGDPHLLSTLYGNLGLVAAKQGDFIAAEDHYRRVLSYARRSGDRAHEVMAMQSLGAVAVDQDHLGVALRRYRRALAAAERAGLLPQRRVLHASLAVALHRAGRHREAADHFARAATVATELGDHRTWAETTSDQGAMLVHLGEHEAAAGLIEQALATFQQLDDRRWIGLSLHNLTEVRFAAGDHEAVIQVAEQALEVLGDNEVHARAHVLLRAAESCLMARDKLDQAEALFERLLVEKRRQSDPSEVAAMTAQAGAAFAEGGWAHRALPFYTRAAESFDRLGDRRQAFAVRNDRAIALTRLQRFEEARLDYTHCLSLAEQLGDPRLTCQAAGNLGEMERQAGNMDVAFTRLYQALDLARDLGNERAEASLLGNLGIALASTGHLDEAQDAFRQGRHRARQIGDRSSEALAIGGLAGVAFERGHFAEAARRYRTAIRLELAGGDRIHAVENLAMLTECWAALGNAEMMVADGQRLLDLAPEIGATKVAARALVRVGGRWLGHGEGELAVDCFAAAIVGGLTNSEEDEASLSEGFADILGLVAYEVESAPASGADEVVERILATVEMRYGEVDGLMPLLHEALPRARHAIREAMTRLFGDETVSGSP